MWARAYSGSWAHGSAAVAGHWGRILVGWLAASWAFFSFSLHFCFQFLIYVFIFKFEFEFYSKEKVFLNYLGNISD